MPVTIHVPHVLSRYSAGREIVSVSAGPARGATVRTALENLFVLHPDLRARTLGKDGALWSYLSLSVNGFEPERDGLLDAAVCDGDVLELVGAAEGG